MFKKFLFALLFVCFSQIAIAYDAIYEFNVDISSVVAKYFVVGRYISRPVIKSFWEKWAQTIKDANSTPNIKSYDKTFYGIGLKKEIFDSEYNPWISLSGDMEKKDCVLYEGVVNSAVYASLNSPILYDAKNKICVAVIGQRNESFLNEPYEFMQYVYIISYLPNFALGDIELKEIAFIPNDIDPKKEKAYLKKIKSLYKKYARSFSEERAENIYRLQRGLAI